MAVAPTRIRCTVPLCCICAVYYMVTNTALLIPRIVYTVRTICVSILCRQTRQSSLEIW